MSVMVQKIERNQTLDKQALNKSKKASWNVGYSPVLYVRVGTTPRRNHVYKDKGKSYIFDANITF